MDVWKYEIISRVEQDISPVRFAHSLDILVNTQNKFHISAHACIILYLIRISIYFRHASDSLEDSAMKNIVMLMVLVICTPGYLSNPYLTAKLIEVGINGVSL